MEQEQVANNNNKNNHNSRCERWAHAHYKKIQPSRKRSCSYPPAPLFFHPTPMPICLKAFFFLNDTFF